MLDSLAGVSADRLDRQGWMKRFSDGCNERLWGNKYCQDGHRVYPLYMCRIQHNLILITFGGREQKAELSSFSSPFIPFFLLILLLFLTIFNLSLTGKFN